MKKYEYLIVGAGLFGSIFAHEATKRGKKCLVIEKRDHIGGNCYTQNIEDINVQNMVLIYFIQAIKLFGTIFSNLLNLTVLLTLL